MEVIPTILATSETEFQQRLEQLATHFSTIHLDVADGQFVTTKTITGWEELSDISSDRLVTDEAVIKWGVHLMVQNPTEWVEKFLNIPMVETVVFHVEADGDLVSLAELICASSRQAIVAIKPETPLEQLEPMIEHIDAVQFMTVEPGRNGAPFVPEVVAKIDQFRQSHPDTPIWADGGITPQTISQVAKAGVTTVCVGSYFAGVDDVQYARQILEQSL